MPAQVFRTTQQHYQFQRAQFRPFQQAAAGGGRGGPPPFPLYEIGNRAEQENTPGLFNVPRQYLAPNINQITTNLNQMLLINTDFPLPHIFRLPENINLNFFINTLRVDHAEPVATNIREQDIEDFILDPQNTHVSSITESVARSLQNLQNRYVLKEHEAASPEKIELSSAIQNIQSEIFLFLQDSSVSLTEEEKNHITNWFHRTLPLHSDTIHASSNLTLLQTLSLIWHAASDKHCMESDIPFSDKDIKDRKTTVLRHLSESQKNTVCFAGNINNLVASLDLCHRDVTIERINHLAELKTATRQEAANLILVYVKNILFNKPFNTISNIYNNWENDDSEAKINFMNEIKQNDYSRLKNFLLRKLNESFGSLLRLNLQTEIIDEMIEATIDYIPRSEIEMESNKEMINNAKIMHFLEATSEEIRNTRLIPFPNFNFMAQRLPRNVALIHTFLSRTIRQLNRSRDLPILIPLDTEQLNQALDVIQDQLNQARIGNFWTRWSRNQATLDFYENTHRRLQQLRAELG